MFQEIKVYGVKNKDKVVHERSSSGGVIHELVKCFVSQQNIVFAASYDYDELRLKFECIKSIDDIDSLKGSKYIQARMDGLYENIENILIKDKEKKILFIGLPCQCFSLKQYFKVKKISTDNLFLVDIICHGVGNEAFLEYFIRRTEKKKKVKITYINFKDKRNGWLRPYPLMKDYANNEYPLDDYLTLYNKSLIIRPSCYNCKFSNLHRVGDITVGDFWNIQNIDETFYDELGVSTVILNNLKGKEIFSVVSQNFEILETNMHDVLQPNLMYPTSKPIIREQFWKDFYKNKYDYVVNKYASKTKKNRIIRYILTRLKIWKV